MTKNAEKPGGFYGRTSARGSPTLITRKRGLMWLSAATAKASWLTCMAWRVLSRGLRFALSRHCRSDREYSAPLRMNELRGGRR